MIRKSSKNRYDYLYMGGEHGSNDPDRRLKYRNSYNDNLRKEQGHPECPRCGKHVKTLSRKHYSDFKNKTPCLPKENDD